MFRSGEAIVLRALDHRYRPLIGLPATVVEDTPDLVVLHLPLGTRVQWYAGATMGGPRDRAILEWPGAHEERDWIGNELLILKRPDEMHSVQVIWSRLDRRFLGWYVNLEERSRRTARGFDVRDLELDLEIAPDLSWHWKDEDVFEWAISAGRIPSGDRGRIRSEGERALHRILKREAPLHVAWESWLPDPLWTLPSLPADWAATRGADPTTSQRR